MITQELVVFVRAELTKGKNVDDIRKELLVSGSGWTSDDIDQVFDIVNPNTPPPANPQAIMPVQPYEAKPIPRFPEQKSKSKISKILVFLIVLIIVIGLVWYFRSSLVAGLKVIFNLSKIIK